MSDETYQNQVVTGPRAIRPCHWTIGGASVTLESYHRTDQSETPRPHLTPCYRSDRLYRTGASVQVLHPNSNSGNLFISTRDATIRRPNGPPENTPQIEKLGNQRFQASMQGLGLGSGKRAATCWNWGTRSEVSKSGPLGLQIAYTAHVT